ncbi:hypothetical protein EZS27_024814 [termite gut metagenome]|uniref:Uncharacterized protein n=1 Tax=termite gut metagenome TaxID=433724 RepID=A0A5J4QW13_9ZZZZ
MNKQFLNKLSSYALYVLFAVILVVLGLFYFGGEVAQPIVPDMSQPEYTDTLLYMAYGLFALVVIVTIAAFLFQFGGVLKDSPINALKSLSGVLIMVVILIVSWSIGSDEKLVITGYEGPDNVPFWLKLTDMFLYSTYFLLAVTLGAMLFSGIKKKIL